MIKNAIQSTLLTISLFSSQYAAASSDVPVPVTKFAEVLKEQYSMPYQITKIEDGKRFWQISLGQNVLFITPDGGYVINGQLFNTARGISYTETAKYKINLEAISNLSEKAFVTYKAPNETDVIWVFSDSDCPYCKRFHQEVPKLNASGVTVKYVTMPLQGEGSNGFNISTSVLCSEYPSVEFSKAFKGNVSKVEVAKCTPLVRESLLTAQKIGIKSTPTILLPNGMIAEGAYQEHELKPILEKIKNGK